jgi:hypothetical protein
MYSNAEGGQELQEAPKHVGHSHTDVWGHMAEWMRTRSPYPGTYANAKQKGARVAKIASYDSMVFLHYSANITHLERFSVGTMIPYS